MRVIVTGGTGFIGNYVINTLLQKNIKVTVTGKSIEKAKRTSWFTKVEFITLDLHLPQPESVFKKIASHDKLIHLVWSNLPNYKDLFHFEENLMPQYFFIKKIVELGLKDITVTGTCFEYGMHNGCLSPNMPSDPQNPYALAKDTLRKFLLILQKENAFMLKWVRLFYMYGEGQSNKSILSQLDLAIENEDKVFNLSGGEQLRDYLPVEEVGRKIADICLHETFDGIINCCSGTPISIRSLVENHLAKHNKNILLNFGYHPYPDYEPMAFWGENKII
jgi:dTDP-6-deoxy-L-talose 4-dehydrogenase (NAD+)